MSQVDLQNINSLSSVVPGASVNQIKRFAGAICVQYAQGVFQSQIANGGKREDSSYWLKIVIDNVQAAKLRLPPHDIVRKRLFIESLLNEIIKNHNILCGYQNSVSRGNRHMHPDIVAIYTTIQVSISALQRLIGNPLPQPLFHAINQFILSLIDANM
jgi:hypothetical protein